MRALPRLLAACLAAAALLCATAPRAHAAGAAPAAVSLNGAGWQYAADPQDRGASEGWQHGRGGAWQPVTLPHVFDGTPQKAEFGGTVGWYRVRLKAPSLGGFDWGVRFQQVRRVAQVFLDGRRIRTHTDPYAPFTVTLPALSDGLAHELVVRVDNRKGKEPREGWWNWGGITRPAQLVPLGTLVTHAPGFLPQRTCDDAGACRWSVLVDADVENRGAVTVRPRLVARLSAPDGARAGSGAAVGRPLAPGERARLRFRVFVGGDAQLWAPGHPSLYGVALETSDGAGVQQVDRTRIGLRTVAVRHGLLELNGRPIQLRGASIQEDVPGRGPAMTDADVLDTVVQLKAVGANVTRAHYALDERLLRRFDEEGILVWGQAPVYHADRQLRTAAGRARALDTVRNTVLAVRNHPSIITHSVANELSVQPDVVSGTRAFLDNAREVTKDLDPTLPTSVDTLSYPGYTRQATYARFDLLGINSYFGWYPGKKNHSTANADDLVPYLRTMRGWYPRAGLVLTEFGAEATMHGPSSEKETYAFQAGYAKRILGVVGGTPTLSGAIWWTLREFAVKPDWDGGALRTGVARDAIHNKGLVTYAGAQKPAWYVLRKNIMDTSLVRHSDDVAIATGIRAPDTDRGLVGMGTAIAILAGVALLVLVDVWAFLGWRSATAGTLEDARRRRRLAAPVTPLPRPVALHEAPPLRRAA
jgi:hypothetical protein